jgi:hypothetical protein
MLKCTTDLRYGFVVTVWKLTTFRNIGLVLQQLYKAEESLNCLERLQE